MCTLGFDYYQKFFGDHVAIINPVRRVMDWEKFLRQEYGDMLAAQTQPSQSVTLIIDLDNLPEDHSHLAHKCALLKRNCMASLFVKFFDLQPQVDPKSDGTRALIHYRPEETM
ncbi:hypothetical protein AHF37_10974 [Paragonimus kellicotti]|nr:hypothetical protein AHF37_10974 [Paragonimus kellicotti]